MILSFPPTSAALEEPNGLLAVGGDLYPQRLLLAYSQGIFPWFSPGEPILWWTPNPRCVLLPEHFRLRRSMRKTLRNRGFTLRCNHQFEAVMRACSAPRGDGEGTWISEEMIEAYRSLHELGFAHSLEVMLEGELVGGLYGINLGRVFFGESMFTRVRDASKTALVALVWLARRGFFELIDCQVESEHLNSLGAVNIPRDDFEARLSSAMKDIDMTLFLDNSSDGALPNPGATGQTTPTLTLDVPETPDWLAALPPSAAELLEDDTL